MGRPLLAGILQPLRLLALTCAVWLAGMALTVCAVARLPAGIAISTGVLFALFCPWAVWLGRTLPAAEGEVPAPEGAVLAHVVAVAPAVLAARAIKAGTFTASGLVPADRQVDPHELADYLGRAGVQFFSRGAT